ncbi:MAG TPA: hypothetical protein VJS66_00480, partial [Burkholderiales bacterium]|nr:hypothetical protein [Burkholderiales bacterium]
MRSTFRSWFYFAVLTVALSLGGCTAIRPQTCEQFDAKRKQTNYATEYRPNGNAGIKPLSKGQAIAVDYELRVDTSHARPCTHVTISKELTLARRADIAFTIEEAWEFYTEDGTRITSKQENLTQQLRWSGRYTASVPLPIPRGAPPGKYYLVSTLIARSK